MRYLLAAVLLLFIAPAFADDANILDLQWEIHRLLNEQPGDVIRAVETLPDVSKESANGNTFARPVEAIDIQPGTFTKPAEYQPAFTTPPLVIHVWPSGCIHGERAVAAIIPKLLAQHWQEGKHYRIVRSYDGPCPQFSWKGRSFGSGWNGWESFNADLRSAMGRASGVASAGVVTVRSAPVRAVATSAGVSRSGERQHSHLCRSCGREWWHRTSEARSGSHNCPNCGRTQYVIHRWGR